MVGARQDDAQVNILQRDVDLVVQFFADVRLKIITMKSHHLLLSFNPTGPQVAKPLIANGDVIEMIDILKYLGVHLDGRISMQQHVEKMTRRARRHTTPSEG